MHTSMLKSLNDASNYRRYILGEWPNEGGENMAIRMNDYGEYCDDNKDIHFLFEKECWNGSKIKNMTSSHIINTLSMLLRKSEQLKQNYELFIIDNMNNTMLVPKDSINELVKKNAFDWIVSTPVYLALLSELGNRGLLAYYDIVKSRLDERGEKNE